MGAPGAGALVVTMLLLLAPTAAQAHSALAYLDPGTGSVVLQLVVGGFLGAALTIKLFWRRILGFFKRSDVRREERSGDIPADAP